MAQTLLLNPNDIPRLTVLNGNIDVDKMTPHVFTAQVNDIKRILGKDLYDKIVADFESDSLTVDYQVIYNDYVIFCLAYYSASYYIGFGSYQISNNGIVKMNVEGGQSVEMKDTQLLAEKYKQMAINFENLLIDYLQTIEIPEYSSENKIKNKRIIPWY